MSLILEKCPFCLSYEVAIMQRDLLTEVYCVRCTTCKARGPENTTQKACVTTWNLYAKHILDHRFNLPDPIQVDHESQAWHDLDSLFDEYRSRYNLSLGMGLEYSSVIDWFVDITPRRNHPKARDYPAWQASGTSRVRALRNVIDLARKAIKEHEATHD